MPSTRVCPEMNWMAGLVECWCARVWLGGLTPPTICPPSPTLPALRRPRTIDGRCGPAALDADTRRGLPARQAHTSHIAVSQRLTPTDGRAVESPARADFVCVGAPPSVHHVARFVGCLLMQARWALATHRRGWRGAASPPSLQELPPPKLWVRPWGLTCQLLSNVLQER